MKSYIAEKQRAGLLDIRDHQAILGEVRIIVGLMDSDFNFNRFNATYADVERLFDGKYEGFRSCNTRYHDFNHTMMVLLAMTRLMHGATEHGYRFSEKEICLGLIGALMHDTGYIQSVDDQTGTGAKYTLTHIRRSIEFVRKYFADDPYFAEEHKNFHDILSCTGVHTMAANLEFASENIAMLGKMLGTADLLGQMADRLYLEKLMFLYNEFEEGGVPGFDGEADLLRKTVSFHRKTQARFEKEFGNVNRFMIDHFRNRWNIDLNVYEESIQINIDYLKFVLKNSQKNIYHSLRRNTICLQ